MRRAMVFSLAILSALLATGAAGGVLIQELIVAEPSVFPTPLLVLLDWATLGIAGAVYIVLAEVQSDTNHLKMAWGILGAYVPLGLLGAFSIGPMTLIGGILLFAPILLVSIRHRPKLLAYFTSFGIGAFGNLVLLVAFITSGRLLR